MYYSVSLLSGVEPETSRFLVRWMLSIEFLSGIIPKKPALFLSYHTIQKGRRNHKSTSLLFGQSPQAIVGQFERLSEVLKNSRNPRWRIQGGNGEES